MTEKILVFSVVGNSDSGKTDLVCLLIEELQNLGYNVATIKHTRGDFTIDSEDKDTWRHSEAGADLVVFSTPEESDFLLQHPSTLEELISNIEGFDDYDIILVEGMKEENIPKISVDEEFKEGSIIHYDGDLEKIVDAVERELEIHEIVDDLAGIDCGECGYPDCWGLAESILEGENAVDDCERLESGKTVQIRIEGEKISLGDFPAEMIEKSVRGMLSSLKGIDGEEEEIELEISESEK